LKKIITDNPAVGLKFPKQEKSLPKYLSLQEIRKLLASPIDSEFDIVQSFELMLNIGLRISDTMTLTWTDISDDGESVSLMMKKTRKELSVPLNDRTKRILADQAARRGREGLVFHLPASHPAYNKYLIRWAKLAGVKHFSAHAGRHSCAVLLINSGVPLFTVGRILGHQGLSSTQIYAAIVDDTKRQALNNISY
jgi:integrase